MIGNRLDIAAGYLRGGSVVGIPTETVYGLAGNALNEHAISTIFSVKERPFFDPLIVHVAEVAEMERYVTDFHSTLRIIADDLMPGPLTILLPRSQTIPDLITAGLDRVAIRIPNHPITRALMKELDFPVAAPSANPFGYISPTSAEHVERQLGHKIPYILDGGACNVGIESTIIGMEDDSLVIYRKGGTDISLFKKYTDNIVIKEHSSSNPTSPGMLKSHYAPNCTFRIIEDWSQIPSNTELVGALSFDEKVEGISHGNQIMLSKKSDINEAAQNLFKSMRQLDAQGFEVIYAKLLPEEGLGIAINDRLKRAAAE